MEARAGYLGRDERPRLTVVHDSGTTAGYSALPHAVLLDARTKHGHVVTYAVLQLHWRQHGECFASHAVMAEEVKCSERQLQRYLIDLERWGFIVVKRQGRGQSRVYSPAKHDTGVVLGAKGDTGVVLVASKATPVSDQHDTGVRRNTTPVSSPYKKKSSKKKNEEELATTLLGAASAAEPATAEPKPKKSRGTRCPEQFPLEAKHFAYGLTLGFDEARTRAETEKFLAHHRFKGTIGRDWYAGWQNWLRKAVEYGAPKPAPYRNGADPKPPARDVAAAWAGWTGRYGSNLDELRGRGDGR